MKNVLIVAAVILVVGGCTVTNVASEASAIVVDEGFGVYILSIGAVAEEHIGKHVFVWFSKDADPSSAGLLFEQISLTIYRKEYIDGDPVQRRTLAEDKLADFLDRVDAITELGL
ncbi:MAG: hypothetical protein GY938_30800 [Ketobacter sp.]|nr:hypothetical protein [Ketobacter sp.]